MTKETKAAVLKMTNAQFDEALRNAAWRTDDPAATPVADARAAYRLTDEQFREAVRRGDWRTSTKEGA